MHPALAYLLYIVTGLIMLGAFSAIYTAVTRHKEFDLIRAGNMAAALSFGGALVGFSFTVGVGIAVHATFTMFLVWGVAAMAVQILVYALLSFCVRGMNEAIEENNLAMGALLGAISLAAGVVNAGCLT
ncbi:hypothetical protein CEG14_17480 [Bordetella genomosp. 1]|uniref:DUF350 domain-containing protein n=1 Tax=Bordetella genomosp. 1 TaxID=1395607 RepID=A0A261S5Q1_9BORD|nr:DUF350 domain-containing protein [Bordetella genomosp. 1]MDQ8033504.1 DUF350 domain-containing protein [Bordetella sp.]OZI32698.1 hypothetical protein CEG14_17480 [Bordetella genomosp. 1]OZI65947.1 hypothetical protein CAL27_13245 [Bordetella genomosp. 1]